MGLEEAKKCSGLEDRDTRSNVYLGDQEKEKRNPKSGCPKSPLLQIKHSKAVSCPEYSSAELSIVPNIRH